MLNLFLHYYVMLQYVDVVHFDTGWLNVMEYAKCIVTSSKVESNLLMQVLYLFVWMFSRDVIPQYCFKQWHLGKKYLKKTWFPNLNREAEMWKCWCTVWNSEKFYCLLQYTLKAAWKDYCCCQYLHFICTEIFCFYRKIATCVSRQKVFYYKININVCIFDKCN